MATSNGQHSFDNLRTVYGAMPVKLTAEYKEVELYTRQLVSGRRAYRRDDRERSEKNGSRQGQQIPTPPPQMP